MEASHVIFSKYCVTPSRLAQGINWFICLWLDKSRQQGKGKKGKKKSEEESCEEESLINKINEEEIIEERT